MIGAGQRRLQYGSFKKKLFTALSSLILQSLTEAGNPKVRYKNMERLLDGAEAQEERMMKFTTQR